MDNITNINCDLQVSICIPAYNSCEKLAECLNSVKKQIGCKYEVIVSDDSTDKNEQLCIQKLCADECVKYYHHPSSLGVPANWNFLINVAQAPLIQMLHHDDKYADERSLFQFVTLMEAHPSCSIAMSSSRLMEGRNEVGETTVTRTLADAINQSPSLLYALNRLGAPSAGIFRRKNEVLYRKGFKYVTDLVYYYDNLVLGELLCINKALVEVDVSKTGRLTTSNESNLRLMIAEFWKMMFVFRLRDIHPRIAVRFLYLVTRLVCKKYLQ